MVTFYINKVVEIEVFLTTDEITHESWKKLDNRNVCGTASCGKC